MGVGLFQAEGVGEGRRLAGLVEDKSVNFMGWRVVFVFRQVLTEEKEKRTS